MPFEVKNILITSCIAKILDFIKGFTAKRGDLTNDLESFGLGDDEPEAAANAEDGLNWSGKYMKQLVSAHRRPGLPFTPSSFSDA